MSHVLKFGGTSVASPEALETVLTIIRDRAQEKPVAVVVSALSGVTSALAAAAEAADSSLVALLRDRYTNLLQALTSGDWNGSSTTVQSLLRLLEVQLRRGAKPGTPAHDEILGVGERLSALLVAEGLRHRGLHAVALDGTGIVRTDATFGNARVDQAATQRLLHARLGQIGNAIPVISGFVGATSDGIPTTLGRGGSDITAAVIGAALDADEVEIWSDVDGIYSADPRIDPTARLHSRLTHAEAQRAAEGGAKVLHPKTVPPLAARGIRLSIRNTFAPARRGTLVESRAPLELVIAGATGNVGSALVRQLRELRPEGVRLRILANSRVTNDAGLCGDVPTNWPETLRSLEPRSLFVDVTASPRVAALYDELLEQGIGIVTANKLAGSGDASRWNRLKRIAAKRGIPLRYETTVGAALPLLRTARELHATGDRLHSLEAVLSGTLSYILARTSEGVAFTDAVQEAQARGLTEPDPAIDLSGRDVAAKLVILLRELGQTIDLEEVDIRPLQASEVFAGRRLAYVGTYRDGVARAAIREIAEDEPLARIRAGENVVVFQTARYDRVPLTVSGPGAGPEVTAAGVLAEILEVAGSR